MLFSVTKLVRLYPIPVIGRIAKKLNFIIGVDIPRSVKIGNNVKFPHNSFGTVIHDKTFIEDDVKIYQNVTIGRSDIWKKDDQSLKGFHIKKGACICAGAKIIGKEGVLTIGEHAVIAANAVVLKSVGDKEIWAGVPARCIGYRDDV